MKKGLFLIIFILVVLMVICFIIPILHDFIFDMYTISNYDKKEGIISDVIIKEEKDSLCENIIVDNYNIFVKCGKDYKPQFKEGDMTSYYIYKNKAYHTEDQMKSGSVIGKILDFGMLGTYILIFLLLTLNKKRIFSYIDSMSNRNHN